MSSAQDQWLPIPPNASGGERDQHIESEATTYSTKSTNKRTGSPSLENPVSPKRIQPEYIECPAVHLSTPQRGQVLPDRSFCTPARNESHQRPNHLQIPDMCFRQQNPHEHLEIDPNYSQPRYSDMMYQGSQFISSHEDFEPRKTTTPQIIPVSHQPQQDLNDFEVTALPFMQRNIRNRRERSENPPRYLQSFQQPKVKDPSEVYQSGGRRQHKVVDLTSPVGGSRLFQATAADLITPVPSPYQARYPPPSQHYLGSNNIFPNQNRPKAHHSAHNQEPGFEIDRDQYYRWEEQDDQGLLGPAFGNPTHQRGASFGDLEPIQFPTRSRQQISYNYSDMDHSIAQETSEARRELHDRDAMYKEPPLTQTSSYRQGTHLTQNAAQDETLVQIMRKGLHPAGEELKTSNYRSTSTGLNDYNTKRPPAKDFKAVQKAREHNIKAQQSAAEMIMERTQQGKELEGLDDVFEESPIVKASEARIQKSIEEDTQRKYRKEEALLAKALKDQYAEELAELRKKRESDERQARRAQRKVKVTEEEKRLARVKETERIERKRLAAEEVLERARVQRQEAALDETLKKLEVERGAAKKQATSLRPARRTGMCSQSLAHKISSHEASSDNCMFVISDDDDDDDDLPLLKDIGKPSRRVAKDDDNGKGDKEVNNRGMAATPAEVTVAVAEDTSMAAIASDDRRRATPARQKRKSSPVTRIWPKRARDTGIEQRKLDILLKGAQKELEKSNADRKAIDEAYKKEWQERFAQLDGMKKALENLVETTRQPVGRATMLSHGKPFGVDIRPESFHVKSTTTLTSQIKFVSQVESEAREREALEKAEREKVDKARRTYCRRTEHEIRRVLASQGIEIDEERIKKTIEERMVAWEDKRRKREQKDKSDGGGHSASPETPETVQFLNGNGDVNSAQVTSPSNGKTAEMQQSEEALLAKKRDESIRAGLNFLRAKNIDGDSSFGLAASKSNIQELDSEESEEDPDDDDDDEPEALPGLVTENVDSNVEKHNLLSVQVPSDEPSDEIIHPISSIPAVVSTSTVFGPVSVPTTINPVESDLVYIYNVSQRSERGEKTFETLVLASFHDLEEANTFAQQKTCELIYNPELSQVGHEMTYDGQNRFIGRAVNNKDENNSELVWVSQVIAYVGDVSNLSVNVIKPTKPCKVYNVLQTMYQKHADLKDTNPESKVVATATVKTLANQKAVDLVLILSRPLKPQIDLVQNYNSVIIPSVRTNQAETDEKDGCVSLEGEDEESGRWFKVEVVECEVMGPKN